MFVLTVDQRSSRKTGDKVPAIVGELDRLWPNSASQHPLLGFTRTVGDEIQGVVESAQEALAVTRLLVRSNAWYVGIGIGAVHEPLPDRAPDATGEAFIYARQAVDEAKAAKGSAPLAVVATNATSAQRVEALLSLIGLTWQSRSELGWQAVDALMDPFGANLGATQRDIAQQLGVSSAAISKRLKAAAYEEERKIYPLLLELLENANTY